MMIKLLRILTSLAIFLTITIIGWQLPQPAYALELINGGIVYSDQDQVFFRVDADEPVRVVIYINWDNKPEKDHIPYVTQYASDIGPKNQLIQVNEGIPANTSAFTYVIEVTNQAGQVLLSQGDRGEIGIYGTEPPEGGHITQAGKPGPIPHQDQNTIEQPDTVAIGPSLNGSDGNRTADQATNQDDRDLEDDLYLELGFFDAQFYKILVALNIDKPPFPELEKRFGETFLQIATLALFFMIGLEIWYLIHRARPWGVVYDSKTKTPIQAALIRIFDKESNRLLETKTTDQSGRFTIVVPEGKYFIEVQKQGYHFPSRLITSQDREYFPNVYRGEIMKIKGNNIAINISVPMDAETDKTALEKTQKDWKLLMLYRLRRTILGLLLLVILSLFWFDRDPAYSLILLPIVFIFIVDNVTRRNIIYGK